MKRRSARASRGYRARITPALVLLFALAALLFALAGSGATTATTSSSTARVSSPNLVDQGVLGVESNSSSSWADMTADGRYVSFASLATNLVIGDVNSLTDIFVHDRTTGTTTLVSVNDAGNQSNGFSCCTAISDDGRYVAFESDATNLVPNDNNTSRDIFVRDVVLSTTTRASIGSAGDQAANGSTSTDAGISSDGRYISFRSSAPNLVSGDTNSQSDAFVRDILLSTTERVSVGTGNAEAEQGGGAPAISGNGRFVAFASGSGDLAPGTTTFTDIFVRDRALGTTSKVSVSSDEGDSLALNSDPAISDDGRFIAFESNSPLLAPDGDTFYDVFVRDLLLGTTGIVSVDSLGGNPDSYSGDPSISGNGQVIAFSSSASNLIPGSPNPDCGWHTPGCPNFYVHDTASGFTALASVNDAGDAGAGGSVTIWRLPVSFDGAAIAFPSSSSNLVPGDTNSTQDIFVRSLGDADDDGQVDPFDDCPVDANSDQTDTDGDRAGDICDNCPSLANLDQTDTDLDMIGDLCDADDDGDSSLPPNYLVCVGCPPGRFSDAVEAFVGTNPTSRCAADTTANNEVVDAWPPDNNDDRSANLSDLVRYGPSFNKTSPDPAYHARYDLNTGGRVNLSDIVIFGPYYNTTCTP